MFQKTGSFVRHACVVIGATLIPQIAFADNLVQPAEGMLLAKEVGLFALFFLTGAYLLKKTWKKLLISVKNPLLAGSLQAGLLIAMTLFSVVATAGILSRIEPEYSPDVLLSVIGTNRLSVRFVWVALFFVSARHYALEATQSRKNET
jgi:hypothetical protein